MFSRETKNAPFFLPSGLITEEEEEELYKEFEDPSSGFLDNEEALFPFPTQSPSMMVTRSLFVNNTQSPVLEPGFWKQQQHSSAFTSPGPSVNGPLDVLFAFNSSMDKPTAPSVPVYAGSKGPSEVLLQPFGASQPHLAGNFLPGPGWNWPIQTPTFPPGSIGPAHQHFFHNPYQGFEAQYGIPSSMGNGDHQQDFFHVFPHETEIITTTSSTRRRRQRRRHSKKNLSRNTSLEDVFEQQQQCLEETLPRETSLASTPHTDPIHSESIQTDGISDDGSSTEPSPVPDLSLQPSSVISPRKKEQKRARKVATWVVKQPTTPEITPPTTPRATGDSPSTTVCLPVIPLDSVCIPEPDPILAELSASHHEDICVIENESFASISDFSVAVSAASQQIAEASHFNHHDVLSKKSTCIDQEIENEEAEKLMKAHVDEDVPEEEEKEVALDDHNEEDKYKGTDADVDEDDHKVDDDEDEEDEEEDQECKKKTSSVYFEPDFTHHPHQFTSSASEGSESDSCGYCSDDSGTAVENCVQENHLPSHKHQLQNSKKKRIDNKQSLLMDQELIAPHIFEKPSIIQRRKKKTNSTNKQHQYRMIVAPKQTPTADDITFVDVKGQASATLENMSKFIFTLFLFLLIKASLPFRFTANLIQSAIIQMARAHAFAVKLLAKNFWITFTLVFLYTFPALVSPFVLGGGVTPAAAFSPTPLSFLQQQLTSQQSMVPTVLWYGFLLWFFLHRQSVSLQNGSSFPVPVSGSLALGGSRHNTEATSLARRLCLVNVHLLVPLLVVFSLVCNSRAVLSWNGGERIVFSSVLLCMKSNSFFRARCFVPLSLLIIIAALAGSNPVAQWVVLITSLSTLSGSYFLRPLAPAPAEKNAHHQAQQGKLSWLQKKLQQCV